MFSPVVFKTRVDVDGSLVYEAEDGADQLRRGGQGLEQGGQLAVSSLSRERSAPAPLNHQPDETERRRVHVRRVMVNQGIQHFRPDVLQVFSPQEIEESV
jgi:hypothetical protein